MYFRRYFFHPWIGLTMVLLLAGFFAPAVAQNNTPTSPALPEMIARANALTDLSSAVPYELHAYIAVNPGSKDAQHGEITIYRDQNRSRLEVQLGDFHQVEVVGEGTRYVSRSLPYPLPGLDVLNNVEDAVHLRTSFPANIKFNKSHARKVGGVAASCIDVKLRDGSAREMRFCFDAVTGAALEADDFAGWQGRFSRYAAIGEKSFPTQIKLTLAGELLHLQLSELQVTSRKFDDASFAAPQGAHAFPVCNGLVGARATLGSQWSISRTHIGETYVYAIVEADGSAHDLTVYGGSKWLQREVSKQARKWKFLAAQCDLRAIASEVVFPLVRPAPEWDYSSGTSSSSYSSERDNSPQNTSTDINQYLNTGMPK